MGLYREPWTDAKGRRHFARTWTYEQIVNGRRLRHRLGVTDRRAAEEMVRDLKVKADRQKAGYVDPFDDHRERPIDDHAKEFSTHLESKGVTDKHLKERVDFLDAFLTRIDALTLADVETASSAAQSWLLELRRQGLSARSVNKRRATLAQFGRWIVTSRRLAFDPFTGLPRLNEKADRRHERRPPSPEEYGRLIEKAPGYRSLLYRFAATTGLRKEEIRSVRRMDLDFEDAQQATVRVRAADTKNGEDCALPVPPSTVAALLPHLKGMDADAIVFPESPNYRTFEEDLRRADVEKTTAEGVIDFHALRSYYATALARGGVPLAQAQKLLRHSDPRLTSNVYTRLGLADGHASVARVEGFFGVAGAAPKDGTEKRGARVTKPDADSAAPGDPNPPGAELGVPCGSLGKRPEGSQTARIEKRRGIPGGSKRPLSDPKSSTRPGCPNSTQVVAGVVCPTGLEPVTFGFGGRQHASNGAGLQASPGAELGERAASCPGTPAVVASPGASISDPLAAVQALLGAASGLTDPTARAALMAGAQAALAGLVGAWKPSGAASGPSGASSSTEGASPRVVDLDTERRRRAGGA